MVRLLVATILIASTFSLESSTKQDGWLALGFVRIDGAVVPAVVHDSTGWRAVENPTSSDSVIWHHRTWVTEGGPLGRRTLTVVSDGPQPPAMYGEARDDWLLPTDFDGEPEGNRFPVPRIAAVSSEPLELVPYINVTCPSTDGRGQCHRQAAPPELLRMIQADLERRIETADDASACTLRAARGHPLTEAPMRWYRSRLGTITLHRVSGSFFVQGDVTVPADCSFSPWLGWSGWIVEDSSGTRVITEFFGPDDPEKGRPSFGPMAALRWGSRILSYGEHYGWEGFAPALYAYEDGAFEVLVDGHP